MEARKGGWTHTRVGLLYIALAALLAVFGCEVSNDENSIATGGQSGTKMQLVFTRQANQVVVPRDVARLEITVRGPGVPPDATPQIFNIQPGTGSTSIVVQAPVGANRVFEIEAFAATSAVPIFFGSITVDVPSTGTTVEVRMNSTELFTLGVSQLGNSLQRLQ